MAFIDEDLLTPKKKLQEQAPPFVTQGPSAIPGAAPAQTGVKPSTSTPFATVDKYVAANKPQAQQLAGQLAEGVTDVATQAKTAISSGEAALGEQVKAGSPTYDPTAVSKAISATSTSGLSQADLEAFKKQKGALYQGPTNISATPEYQKAMEAVSKANQTEQLIGTEAGQKELLAQRQKTTASGITDLNQAFISMSPGARQQIEKSKESFTGLDELFKAIPSNIQPGIEAGQAAATQAQTFATTETTNAIKGLVTDLNNKLKTAQITREDYNKQLATLAPILSNVITTPNKLVTDPTKLVTDAFAATERTWGNSNFTASGLKNLSKYFVPPTTSLEMFKSWQNLKLAEAIPQMADVLTQADVDKANLYELLTGTESGLPDAPGTQLDLQQVPEGLQPLADRYVADQKRAQNTRDLSLMFGTKGGPTDALRGIYEMRGNPVGGKDVTEIAKEMMAAINRFGAGHYPGLTGETVVAIERIAAGSLDPSLYTERPATSEQVPTPAVNPGVVDPATPGSTFIQSGRIR